MQSVPQRCADCSARKADRSSWRFSIGMRDTDRSVFRQDECESRRSFRSEPRQAGALQGSRSSYAVPRSRREGLLLQGRNAYPTRLWNKASGPSLYAGDPRCGHEQRPPWHRPFRRTRHGAQSWSRRFSCSCLRDSGRRRNKCPWATYVQSLPPSAGTA